MRRAASSWPPVSMNGSTGTITRRERLREELDRIRRVLARDPAVLQLRVFGSYATEEIHAWSDLDLVVVMETEALFVERATRLAQLIKPTIAVQFLVYTPEELAACRARRFVRDEIMGKGMTMPLHPHEDAQRWLAFAGEDLRMAELALREGLFNQTCFHAQQCAEKSLKAWLAWHGEPLPRTHALAELFDRLPELNRSRLESLHDGLLVLDQLYVPTRYPDALPGTLASGLPARAHAEAALRTATACYTEVVAACQSG